MDDKEKFADKLYDLFLDYLMKNYPEYAEYLKKCKIVIVEDMSEL